MKKIIYAVATILLISASGWAAIHDIKTSNHTSAAVTISWITDGESGGEVHYSKDSNLSNPSVAYDIRGGTFVGCTHYVDITNLEKENTYYFEVVSGGEVDNNGGRFYTFRTMKEPSNPPGICLLYGYMYQEDKITPAEGAIVYLGVRHNEVNSYPLSKLIDSKGSFVFNLKEARSVNTDDIFYYFISGDPISLEAVYSKSCNASVALEFESCEKNCGSIFLEDSQSNPTSTSTTVPTPIPNTSTTALTSSTTTSAIIIHSTTTTTALLSTTTTVVPLPEYEVAIDPPSAQVLPLETLQFTASTFYEGEMVEGTYIWYVDSTKGSSIDGNGLFRAGAVAETVTATVVDKAHGDAMATALVTVSPIWPMAYDEMWADKKHENLSLLRTFRDRVLAKSEEGRKYTFMLYSNSLEILILLLQDPLLAKETKIVIDELLPGIQPLIAGGRVVLTKKQLADFETLLTKFEMKGSPLLKMAIEKVKSDIREEKLFEGLTIHVVE